MYRTLTHPKSLGGLPDGGIMLNDIIGYINRTLFDVILQKNTPSEYFFTVYEGFPGGMHLCRQFRAPN